MFDFIKRAAARRARYDSSPECDCGHREIEHYRGQGACRAVYDSGPFAEVPCPCQEFREPEDDQF